MDSPQVTDSLEGPADCLMTITEKAVRDYIFLLLFINKQEQRLTAFAQAPKARGQALQKHYPSYYARHRDTLCIVHERPL